MKSHLGRYAIEGELGRGAMGVVYRGFHPGFEVPVAIKVLGDSYSRDDAFRKRFQREASVLQSLNHPGIVRVFDFDHDGDSLFIVMEFVEGPTLRSMLQADGALAPLDAMDVMQQLLSAVGAAHSRGVVHRDLKPDNIIVSNRGKAKVMDFGISKLLVDSEGLTGTDSAIGTPAYMSPEQINGDHVDARSDVYSLGAILYELLQGTPPFTGALAKVLHDQIFKSPPPAPGLSAVTLALVRRAMAKKREERFSSCEEFSGSLLQVGTAHLRGEEVKGANFLGLRLPGMQQPAPRPAPTEPPGALAATTEAQCTESGCTHRAGFACAYSDSSGAVCATTWCSRHSIRVDDEHFCRRHAGVVRALRVHAGTIREVKLRPAVGDRSLSLAALVAEDINRDVAEILRRRYRSRADVSVVADRSIRGTPRGHNVVSWERTWSAMRTVGYETRITVLVGSDAPATVIALVGSRVIFSEIPDWISRREAGQPPDPADRARFRARLVDAISEAVDQPAPLPAGAVVSMAVEVAPSTQPDVDPKLLDLLVMRFLGGAVRMAGHELSEALRLPFATVEPILQRLSHERLVEAGGIGQAADDKPLAQRMTYSLSTTGRGLCDELSRARTRYLGPAPVSLAEYVHATTEVILPPLDDQTVRNALDGLELAQGVAEAVRAAVGSRGSLFLYGPAGNGKTSLARRLSRLLRGPVLVPHAIDLGGEVMQVADPSVHSVYGEQPADRRWLRVERPLVQVGGEFHVGMLDPLWDENGRFYHAPVQVRANGGVLLIDDFGRQPSPPKAILDRLMVPLEQAVDFMNLSASGRKAEVPFRVLLALATNLSPAELLDEAYLRRLAYKVRMPDLDPAMYRNLFERERERLGIPPQPGCFAQIGHLYGDRPIRGNHPRDLLLRLRDVSGARGVPVTLSPELIDAAWNTLFVTA